jgi:hypothetical protein
MHQLVALIVDEGEWLTAAMGFAMLAVAIVPYRYRHADVPTRRRVLAAMNLFSTSDTICIPAGWWVWRSWP